jgi:hypothetical protein
MSANLLTPMRARRDRDGIRGTLFQEPADTVTRFGAETERHPLAPYRLFV